MASRPILKGIRAAVQVPAVANDRRFLCRHYPILAIGLRQMRCRQRQ